MRSLIPLLLALLLSGIASSSTVHAQRATWGGRTERSVIGVVQDGETGKTLPGANVFLDGTTHGTAADERGRFHLRRVPPGTYKLIVSMIGYQTLQTLVTLPNASRRVFRFRPAPKPVELPGVTVRANHGQWEARYQRFEKAFLGNTENAARTRIENPDVLSFEKANDTLYAYANRPLTLVNEALGYEIAYHLRRFSLSGNGNFRRNGSGFFREMEPGSAAEKNRWWRARRRAYHGSLMHFTRALAQDRTQASGFRLYWTKHSSEVADRDDRLHLPDYATRQPVHDPQVLFTQPDSTDRMRLHFGDHPYLLVVYEPEEEAASFIRDYYFRGTDKELPSGYAAGLGKQASWIKNPSAPVLLDARSGLALTDAVPLLLGYWSWSERLAERLPRGYRPGTDVNLAALTLSAPGVSRRPPADSMAASAAEAPAAAGSARVAATVAACTEVGNVSHCTLSVEDIRSLRVTGVSLPLRPEVRWPSAALSGSAPPPPGSRVVVTLRPDPEVGPLAPVPRWVVAEVLDTPDAAE